MMWSVCTLLLTPVAFMASRASVPTRAAVEEHGRSGAVTLTRFVCAKCSETGHIGASKPCSASKLGIWGIQVDVRTSDVMAGAGGAAGPAPDVRHQPEPEGTVSHWCHVHCVYTLY